MGRVAAAGSLALFQLSRGLGAILPVKLMWAVSWPFAAAQATRDVVRSRSSARGRRAGGGWREQVAVHTHRPLLYWPDRWARGRYSSRFEIDGLDALRAVIAARPVVAVTLHYGPLALLPSLLRSRGIPAAIVVNDRLWPLSRSHRRKADLTRMGKTPTHLPAADPRSLLRFLRPGVCLVIAPDFARGKTIEVAVEGGGRITLASGAFRLARQSRAVVVPVLMIETGRWQYRLHIGAPVSESTLVAGDAEAAQATVADLWPMIAADPRQARGKLITSVTER